jgi:hypothetical protein
MRDQLHLLRTEPWDVLIILDACRADVFRELCIPDAEVVRSPARRTDHWLQSGVGKVFRQRKVLYFAANPVIARETWGWKQIERVDVWDRWWARHGPQDMPYVHPLVVNGIVAAWADLGRLEGRTVVVHQLAPHSPYIGEPSYELTWFRHALAGCKLAEATRAVSLYPPRADIDWDRLKRAYRANVRIAWEAARMLADRLTRDGRRVVITADHGDLLGETKDGLAEGAPRFGHQGNYHNKLLYEVPWLPWTLASDAPATISEKLGALGYV